MKKNELIRNFTWGFIPIILFLIADSWFGVVYGLAVAIGFGLIELLYFYIKEKTIEKFILFDIGLLVLLGGISILLKNDLLFKLKPALMELILVIVLAIHGFTNHPVLFIMARRYFGDIEPAPQQKELMRKLVRIMAVILLGHVFLIVWAAWFWSREWWAFISGGLFYVIVVLMAAGQWVYIRKNRNIQPPEKMVDLCDMQGEIIKRLPESLVVKETHLYRPYVFIQMIDKKNRLYLVQNSMEKWACTFSAGLYSGDGAIDALRREGYNLDGSALQPLARYPLQGPGLRWLVHLLKLDAGLIKNDGISQIPPGRYWSVFEIRKNLERGYFDESFVQTFKIMRQLHLF